MKLVTLSLFLSIASSANALSGLQELVDTYHPDAPTNYWEALGTPLERGLAHITLKAITNPNNNKNSRKSLLQGFLKNLQPRKALKAEWRELIGELERHGLRMFEELTLPIPTGRQNQLQRDKSLEDFDDCM